MWVATDANSGCVIKHVWEWTCIEVLLLLFLQVRKQQMRIQDVLSGAKIAHKVVDVSANKDDLAKMRDIVGDSHALAPQIANGDDYCGVQDFSSWLCFLLFLFPSIWRVSLLFIHIYVSSGVSVYLPMYLYTFLFCLFVYLNCIIEDKKYAMNQVTSLNVKYHIKPVRV